MRFATDVRAGQAARQALFIEVLHTAGEARLAVMGTSMLPAIWPGDIVTVRRCKLEAMRPGDVVFYRRSEVLVAHRLLAKLGDCFLSRGDSLPACDPPADGSAVLGQIIAIERNGRPVPVARSWRLRIASALLRHSELCTRVALRLRRWKELSARRRGGHREGLIQQNSALSAPRW